jgi:hypothetical protein
MVAELTQAGPVDPTARRPARRGNAGLPAAGAANHGISTDTALTQGFWLSAAVLGLGVVASLLPPRKTTQGAAA